MDTPSYRLKGGRDGLILHAASATIRPALQAMLAAVDTGLRVVDVLAALDYRIEAAIADGRICRDTAGEWCEYAGFADNGNAQSTGRL